MTAQVSRELLGRFSDYIVSRTGLHFSEERLGDLEKGMRKACREFGHEDVESCMRWLMLSPVTKSGTEILASHLTVGETYFFRDKKLFDILEGNIFPELIRKRHSARYLRIWSAGCASGEEPYSIAILLSRMLPDFSDWNITILGTDINPGFLRKASNGIYGEWSFREVPSWVKDRYFRKTAKGLFEILPDIKKRVTFSYLNLAEDVYPALATNTNAMDIIFCRNVIMYFSRDYQTGVGQKLYRSLTDGGLLIVSPAEISAELFSPFVRVDLDGAMLYKKDIKMKSACPLSVTPLSGDGANEKYFPQPSIVMPEPEVGFPDMQETLQEADAAPVSKSSGPYEEALELYNRGCYEDAGKKIESLVESEAGNVRALSLLSHIYANQGMLDAALELCQKAVSHDRLDHRLHYLMATIQQEKGLTEEAEDSLKRTLYLDQNFVLAHFSLGNLALRNGKTREAERHFGNALSILKTFAENDIIPESEGITAGRLEQIIKMNMKEIKTA